MHLNSIIGKFSSGHQDRPCALVIFLGEYPITAQASFLFKTNKELSPLKINIYNVSNTIRTALSADHCIYV